MEKRQKQTLRGEVWYKNTVTKAGNWCLFLPTTTFPFLSSIFPSHQEHFKTCPNVLDKHYQFAILNA